MRHWICIPTTCENLPTKFYTTKANDVTLKEHINKCYNEKFDKDNLKGSIVEFKCENREPLYEIEAYDVIVLYVFNLSAFEIITYIYNYL